METDGTTVAPTDGDPAARASIATVIVADPRGFCAGVEMAIKALGWMLRLFEPPVYCYHEIVHNKAVVDVFRRAGVIFVDDVDDVPPDAPLMLSAHGSAPAVVDAARSAPRVVVDAVCPLVTKVHHEARVRARKGFRIIYVGHEGHDEAVGTMAEAPDAMHLVESVDDVDALALPDGTDVALLAQTTLAHGEWSDVLDRARERHPELWTPGRSDLCFATTNRQTAVTSIAPDVDLLLVIGSENSSNTQALVRTAVAAGCPRALRIDDPDDLGTVDLTGVRTVGVTAGASAAESVVRAVVERLGPAHVEQRRVTDEDEYFPLPRELRELIRALDVLVGLSVGRTARAGGLDHDDRTVSAAAVLDALSSNP
jgi:4-hydroxy-3-methylbut-2-enyl diphosphate reductase